MRPQRVILAILILTAGCTGSTPDQSTQDELANDASVTTDQVLPYVSDLPESYQLQSEQKYTKANRPGTLANEFDTFHINKYHYRTFIRGDNNGDVPLYLSTKITVHENQSAVSRYVANKSQSGIEAERVTVGDGTTFQVQQYQRDDGDYVVRSIGSIGNIVVEISGIDSTQMQKSLIVELTENTAIKILDRM